MSKNIFANLSIENDSLESSDNKVSSGANKVSSGTKKVSSGTNKVSYTTKVSSDTNKSSSDDKKVSSDKVSSDKVSSDDNPVKTNVWSSAKKSGIFSTEDGDIKTRSFDVDITATVDKLNQGGWTAVTSKKKTTEGFTDSKKVSKPYKDTRSNGGYKGRPHKNNTDTQRMSKDNLAKDNSAKSVSSNSSQKVPNENSTTYQPMAMRKMPDTKPSYANMANKPALPVTKPEKKEEEIPFKTKSFSKPVIRSNEAKTNEPLPEYYTKRDENNEFQVHFNSPTFIKKIAGIEKSTNNQNMYQSIVNCTIEYYSKSEYMMNTAFFRSKMGIDNESQEKVFILVFVQVISLLVHRLVRSDSVDIIKAIFTNLPLFDAVSDQHIRRTGDVKANENLGIVVYERIRNRWITDMKTIKNMSKRSDVGYFEELTKATERTESTKKMLFEHLYQSEWNQNNLCHSAIYYGAAKTMNELIKIGIERKMYIQLNKMLTVKNGINETYGEILTSGLNDAEKNDKRNNVSNFLFRKRSFDECRRLYGVSMTVLREHSASLIEKEANDILSESGIEVDVDDSNLTIDMPIVSAVSENDKVPSSECNEFDDTNTIELLQSGNMEGMIDYIVKNHKLGNIQNIKSTIGIWKNIASSDNQYEDYIVDVLECADIDDIIREIFPERFDTSTDTSTANHSA